MRTIPPALQSHLVGETTTLATLWRVTRRDGAVFTFTDHDEDILYGGETYAARIGYRRSALASQSTLAVDDAEHEGLIDDAGITERDLRAGLWDGATAVIFAVNWTNPANGQVEFKRGTFGEVVTRDDGTYRTELRSLSQPLQVTIGEVYQPTCKAQLGDARCKLPILPPAFRGNSTAYGVGARVRVAFTAGGTYYDAAGAEWECTTAGTTAAADPGGWILAPGATVADGTVVWTCRVAWTRPATISSGADGVTLTLLADDIASYADGWFDGGVCIWDSGQNAGVAREIIGWTQVSRQLLLLGPPPFLPMAGDVLRLQPGCDRLKSTCQGKFANYPNFRGEPHVGGMPGMVATA